MSRHLRSYTLLGWLVIFSMILAACPAPMAPAGGGEAAAPAAAEATAPAAAEAPAPAEADAPKVLRVNLNTFPDMLDPQKKFVRQ